MLHAVLCRELCTARTPEGGTVGNINRKEVGRQKCTDGVWEHETRGRGAADENDEKDADHVPDNGHSGHFGVLAGNWGGK